MPSTWLSNNKAKFSVVEIENKIFLVCTSVVGSISVKYVEDLKTGRRIFPTVEQAKSVNNIDELVRLLISEL